MQSADLTPTLAAPAVHDLTAKRLRVVKGCGRVWSGKAGHYIAVRAGELWTVTNVEVGDDRGAVVTLVRGGLRMRLVTAQAAKLARARFNLNTGDPTVFVTFEVQP